MKKQILCVAIFATLSIAASTGAQAVALNSGDILRITNAGTPSSVTSGSYFAMDISSDGIIQTFEKVGLYEGTTGLVIGTTTLPGAYGSNPNPAAPGPIVQTWQFFGSTGTNYLTVPVTGSTTAGLDMSGWRVAWNSVPEIDMGGSWWTQQGLAGAWQPANCAVSGCTGYTFTNSIARFQWDGIYGNAYTLDYTATVPRDGKTGFGGVPYYLHLEGTVQQPVPIPAAVWLFGSGLIGLFGVARRQKN